MNLIVKNENYLSIRLDQFLASNTAHSRTYIESLIEEGFVKVNGILILKPSYKVKLDDEIELTEKKEEILDINPENLDIKILYEDEDILIVDKERGMVVHPSNGHTNGTLVNAIMYHCKDKLSTINGVVRPGIVHRIDKDTSGILCICKNDFSHHDISLQFKEHSNVRKYKAVVKGVINSDCGIINKPIGRDKKFRMRMAIDKNGKNAETHYKVLKRYTNYTYIECELMTGRTHQIRVHMKDLGHPLLGDLLYGNIDKNFKNLDGQILHAYYLKLIHLRTRKEIEFTSDLPDYFKEVLHKLDEIQ